MRKKNKAIYMLMLIFVSVLARFIYKGNNTLEKSKFIYSSKKIPKPFNGFKVVQISDLHNKSFGLKNKNLLDMIDEEKPDIVVVTGDIYYSYRNKIQNSLRFLENVAKKYPVYLVSGNHEQRDDNWLKHKNIISGYGITILDNKVDTIQKDGQFIQIYGLQDPSFYHKIIRYKLFERKLKQMKHQIDDSKLAILLSHRPEKFDMYVKNGVDLVFTGHAHGGQARIFGRGIISPGEGFFPKYTGGVYKKNNTTMILSRGLGRTIFTSRIGNNPNVVAVELRAK